MARALSRPRLGHGEGARHPLQHRRRHPHGARHRRAALRPVVGLPLLRLGAQRRRLRQRRDAPQRLPPQLSLRHRGQRRGQALPRRRRRLPQLHLREIRPRHPAAARRLRLAGVRRAGQAPDARRIQAPRRDQGDRPTRIEDLVTRMQDVDADAIPQHRARVQRRDHARRAVQSQRQGRPPHPGPRGRQDQLGDGAGAAAVRGLFGRLRNHVHVRRTEDRHHRHACSTSRMRRCPGFMRRANWSAASSISTIPAPPD